MDHKKKIILQAQGVVEVYRDIGEGQELNAEIERLEKMLVDFGSSLTNNELKSFINDYFKQD
jgi:hypothetical protein